MTSLGFFSVAIGAVIGAWLRWVLSVGLNSSSSLLPLGTLLANLIGAYLIGVVAEILSMNQNISPQIRLFFVTGLLGALTTFSTFSLEAVTMLMRQQYVNVMLHFGFHLFGSILFTGLGILTARFIRRLTI